MISSSEPAVMIVGAGPVGLITALVLAQQGVASRVIEAEPGLTLDLRAGTFHPPTLEMLDGIGVAAEMLALGIAVRYWQSRDLQEGLLAEWDLDLLRNDTPYPYRLHLEQHLRRRPAAMPPPKRRVTLQELIDQLQIMASQLKLVKKVDKPRRFKGRPSVQTMREALELAHQENLTQVALEIEQVLYGAAKEQNSEEQYWNLEELIDLWIQTKQPEKNGEHHESEHGNLVSVFWALLLLSAQSKVELFQKEFYQEIQIRLPS